MRRILFPLCLLAAGCNAPIAAVMDTAFPSRAQSKPPPEGNPGPGVDVRPNPDPVRPAPNPNPNPGPLPPPDFGP